MKYPGFLYSEPNDYGMITKDVARMPATPLQQPPTPTTAVGVMPWGAMAIPSGVHNKAAPTPATPSQPSMFNGQAMAHGLIGMGGAMMQAAGPSYDPRSGGLGNAVGAGMQGMYQGLNQGMQLQEHQYQKAQRAKQMAAREKLSGQLDGSPYKALFDAGYDREAVASMLAQPKDTRTALVQNYQFAKQNGFKGSLTDFMAANKATTNINMNSGSGMDGVMTDLATDGFKSATEAAAKASRTLSQLGEFEQLLSTGVPTGKVAEMTMPVRNVFSAFGVDDADLPVQEAMQSLSNRLALMQHQPGMGPMTDSDIKVYRTVSGSLANTQAGNWLTVTRAKREMQGQILYKQKLAARLRSEGAAGYMPEEIWQEVQTELGPMIPTAQDDKAINGLPKNTVYYDADGNVRVRR